MLRNNRQTLAAVLSIGRDVQNSKYYLPHIFQLASRVERRLSELIWTSDSSDNRT